MDEKNINFLFEIGSLRHMERAWKQALGMPVENVLEHTLRMMLIALTISRMEAKEGRASDEAKIMKMVLLHDLSESRTLDSAFIHKEYIDRKSEKAEADMLTGTLFERELPLLAEYSARESFEARIVKDADNLEVDIELKELASRGSELAKKWQPGRRIVRDTKLHTDSAKVLWDKLQIVDPDAWSIGPTSEWIEGKKMK